MKFSNSLLDRVSSVETKPLKWKGQIVPNYIVSSDGNVYHDGKELTKRQINGRNYVSITINNHIWAYRVDYIVAYTFIGMFPDSIRLLHLDDNIGNDKLINLQWYRKSDIVQKYIDLAIIEEDGSINCQWRPCSTPYNPNLGYEVSNFGQIRDVNHKPVELHESMGYIVFYYLDANYASQTRIKVVHQAVAEAFIPNPNNYPIANHLDGNKWNNCVFNLEWADRSMNAEHAYLQNLNNREKYNLDQIRKVCELLTKGDITHIDISALTGVDRKTISDIYRG